MAAKILAIFISLLCTLCCITTASAYSVNINGLEVELDFNKTSINPEDITYYNYIYWKVPFGMQEYIDLSSFLDYIKEGYRYIYDLTGEVHIVPDGPHAGKSVQDVIIIDNDNVSYNCLVQEEGSNEYEFLLLDEKYIYYTPHGDYFQQKFAGPVSLIIHFNDGTQESIDLNIENLFYPDTPYYAIEYDPFKHSMNATIYNGDAIYLTFSNSTVDGMDIASLENGFSDTLSTIYDFLSSQGIYTLDFAANNSGAGYDIDSYARKYIDTREVFDFRVDGAYVQYRSYSDQQNSRYRGWIGFTKNGTAVTETDILDIVLLSSSGQQVPMDYGFHSDVFYRGAWNATQGKVAFYGTDNYSGFSINLDDIFILPEDSYTYAATTSFGSVVNATLSFPGKTILPSASSLVYDWKHDGSLTLSWEAPLGTYDRTMIILYEWPPFNDIMYVAVPPHVEQFSIPASLMQKIRKVALKDYVQFEVQTRSYTESLDNNYARGYSPSLQIPMDVDLCEGDFDEDNDVDGADLAAFAADFGRTDCSGDCEGDFDQDGDVDGADLSVFASDFGRTGCP